MKKEVMEINDLTEWRHEVHPDYKGYQMKLGGHLWNRIREDFKSV